MPDKYLWELFSFVCNHRLASQSDVRMDALARMAVAYNDLLCLSAFDDVERRGKIRRKIDALFRASAGSTVGDLLRMYRLTKDVTMGIAGPKDRTCSELYGRLIGDCVKRPDAKEEIPAMRCVVYELGDTGPDEGFDFYPWFRKRCRAWISSLDSAGCWRELPVVAALQRLEVLQDNSCVFGDTDFDSEILRAYAYYKQRLALPDRPVPQDLPLLGAWYDLLSVPGVVPYEPVLLQRLACSMERLAAGTDFRSDVWYRAVGYAVVQGCAELSGRLSAQAAG